MARFPEEIFSHLSVRFNRANIMLEKLPAFFYLSVLSLYAFYAHIHSMYCVVYICIYVYTYYDMCATHNLIKIEIYSHAFEFVNIQRNSKPFLITVHNAIYAKRF